MNMIARFLAVLAMAWHRYISPSLPGACRFEPSCSQYLAQALRQHGLGKGLVLGLQRIGRCHPWGPAGLDPVPRATPKKGLS